MGLRLRHTVEEKTRETPAGVAETIQQGYQSDPVCGRAIHSPSESMADPFYPLYAPRITTIRAINVIRRIMFYQLPAEPRFPSN